VQEAGVATTNFEKFQTGNPIVRRLIDRFYGEVATIVGGIPASSALDAGCGEGETLARLGGLLPEDLAAIDLNPESAAYTAARFPTAAVETGSIAALPYPDDRFDLVLCLEVLEHIEDPDAALADLERVGRRDFVISTPDEPWFRLGSLLRGKYPRSLGDHPEHVNHWTPSSLSRFLSSRLEVVRVRRSLPWLVAHCRKRD
jgi:2-polyprenyl-3-methyl-5-hydroxy-6-metoxy-1,4-benzoquinol methylase